jgi:iron complex transport system ATP-binding protein
MNRFFEAASISVHVGSKTLLENINLSFDRGQGVALIGPNGAGKSTLLRVLSGEIKPQSGHVCLNGRRLASYSPQILADHRAVLSQQVAVAFPFTVAEIVRMGVSQRHGSKIDALVEATLAELDLIDLADRAITALSGGEQQRVHFARVLVQFAYGQERDGSGILLLDEPTANLDLRHQLGILEILKHRVARGAFVMAVFHDLNLASLFATRVVVLNHGHIDCAGRPDETITSRMLERVFGIETRIGQAASSATPFVLPHTMGAVKRIST